MLYISTRCTDSSKSVIYLFHIVHCKKLDSRSALRTRGRCEQHASRSRRGMHCEFIIQTGFPLSFIFFNVFIRDFYNYSIIIDNQDIIRFLLRNYTQEIILSKKTIKNHGKIRNKQKTKTCICNYVLIIDNYHNFEEVQKSIKKK